MWRFCVRYILFDLPLNDKYFPTYHPLRSFLPLKFNPSPKWSQVFDRTIQLPYDDFEFRGLNLESEEGHKRSEKFFLMDPKSYN